MADPIKFEPGSFFDTFFTQIPRAIGLTPPDPSQNQYQQKAAEQLANNRMNTSGPFASQTFGPNGVSLGFNGPLANASQSAQQQYADILSQPLNFGGLPQLNYGADAAQGARDAAYSQATSRLDPMFDQREARLKNQLANQGLDPSSEAYANALSQFGRDRNDAYAGAQNAAFGQGMAAQGQAFGQSAQARQQMLAELLQGRADPLRQLQGLNSLTGQPDYAADNSTLGAYGLEQAMQNQQRQQGQNMWGDIIGGLWSIPEKIGGGLISGGTSGLSSGAQRHIDSNYGKYF